jgi:hypothetical protein
VTMVERRFLSLMSRARADTTLRAVRLLTSEVWQLLDLRLAREIV